MCLVEVAVGQVSPPSPQIDQWLFSITAFRTKARKIMDNSKGTYSNNEQICESGSLKVTLCIFLLYLEILWDLLYSYFQNTHFQNLYLVHFNTALQITRYKFQLVNSYAQDCSGCHIPKRHSDTFCSFPLFFLVPPFFFFFFFNEQAVRLGYR